MNDATAENVPSNRQEKPVLIYCNKERVGKKVIQQYAINYFIGVKDI